MSGFIKKTVASLVLASGLMSVTFADNIYTQNDVPFYPQNYGAFYPAGDQPVYPQSYGAIFTPNDCDPCASWYDNLSIYGSWLYWKVNGDEFDYAVDKRRETNNGLVRDHESIHDVKFGWDSGFRVGIGAELPRLCWRTDVVWTHFNTSSSKSKEFDGTPGTTETFVSLPAVYNFGTDLLSGESTDLSGRVNFRYDTVDLEFGKWCCCNHCVQFRPHVGIRLAEIRNGFHDKVQFNGGFETFSATDATHARFFAKNRFRGAGIRAGLDLDLCLCEGWSIIGRGAGSVLWGRTHISQSFKFTTETIANFYHGELNESYRNSRILTDLSLGIRYKTTCGCFPVIAELAWEHHYIFGQHRFWVNNSFAQPLIEPDSAPNSPLLTTSSWKKNGDISLQGLTLSIGVEF